MADIAAGIKKGLDPNSRSRNCEEITGHEGKDRKAGLINLPE
jgi:hypothetical protein